MQAEPLGFLPAARRDGIISKQADGELLIYDTHNDRAHCLNGSAAEIWKLCDGATNATGIARKLSAAIEQGSVPKIKTRSNARGHHFARATNVHGEDTEAINQELVWIALAELRRANLLEEPKQPWPDAISGMSRREAIRRIALGAAIAVPVVVSITAPTAVDAVSCGGTCAPCTTSAQCCRACLANVPGCGTGRSCT